MLHHQRPPTSRSYSASGRNSAGSGSGAMAGAGTTSAFARKPATPSKCAGSTARSAGRSVHRARNLTAGMR